MQELKPTLRFDGFDDAWEQRKLGELVTIASGMAPSLFCEGDNLYVKVDDLNYSSRVQFSTQTTVANSSCMEMVPPGSTIFAKRGAAIMTNKTRLLGAPAYMDTNMMALTPYGIDGDFLFELVSRTGLYRIADTSTIPQINNKHIEPYGVVIPVTKEEQESIASFFTSLDSLIALHQREYDKLLTTKQSLVQKMFPKAGETEPELRFGGFSMPYERRQVESIFHEYDVRDHAGLPVLSAHQKLGMVPRTQIGYEVFHDEAQERTYKHICPGQFVIHLRSFQGGFAHSAVEGIASPAYTVLEFCNAGRDYDLYWKHLFMSQRFIDSLRTVTYGIRDGRSISVPEFKKLFFYTPCYAEQKAVGVFLTKLDNLISLRAQELEKLKQIKSGLLQRMFV